MGSCSMNQTIMRSLGFNEEVDLYLLGDCPLCHKHVNRSEFRDLVSREEFFISGLCQECQDVVFFDK